MKKFRQLALTVLLALLSSFIVFGSISLSYLESGYVLADAAEASGPYFVFPNMENLRLFGGPAAEVAGAAVVAPQPAGNNIGPTQPQPTACQSAPAGWIQIVLAPDDTLRSLAERYNLSLEALQAANCLIVERIQPGVSFYVPTLAAVQIEPTQRPCYPRSGWVAYIVRPGDSLYSLSLRVGTAVSEILAANCLSSASLRLGQQLLLPYYPLIPATPSLPTIPPFPPTALPTWPPTVQYTPQTTAYIPTPLTPVVTTVVVTTEPPVTTTEPPAVTTEPPVITTEPPLTTTEPPAVTTEPPLTTTEPSPATTEEPPAATEEPPVEPQPQSPPTPAPPTPAPPTPAPPTPAPPPTSALPAPLQTTPPPVGPPATEAPDPTP